LEKIKPTWKSLSLSGVFLVVLLGGSAWLYIERNTGNGQVTLENKTGKTILDGRLKIGEQIFPFFQLKVGEKVSFGYKPGFRSSPYQIVLNLEDQRRGVETIGSVGWGANYNDLMILGKNQVTLESHQGDPAGHYISSFSQSKNLKWFSLR
jgi:hypothetical protein